MLNTASNFARPAGGWISASAACFVSISLAAVLLARLLIAANLPIVADEAVYWSWSRHLAWGYLDHPPMVAWLIHLSTSWLGNTSIGVRFFATLLACSSVGLMLLVAVRLNRDPRRLGWCAVLLLSSPLVAVLATVMTPDTPAIFCSAGVLLFTVIAIENSQSRWRNLVAWLVAGLFAGAALVAKYTTVLVPLAILVALISSRDGRRQLTHLGPYLAAALALLIFSPVIHWNSTHEWASFKFQLNHGLRAGSGADSPGEEHPAPESKPVGSLGGLLNLGIFLGGQALVWNPVLATLGVIAIVALFRRYRSLPPVQHVLLWCSIVPLLFFGLASIRARGEMNWPAFAYFPLAILTADYTVGRKFGDAAWMKWLRIGVIAAVVMTIGVSAPLLLLRLGVKFPKFNELLGWNAFAADAEAKSQSLPIVGESARDGACLAFYLPGQPEVPIFAGGASPTAYDYMDDRPDPRGWSRVAYVGMHEDVFCRRYGFVIEHRDAARCKLETGKVRSRPMAILVRAPVAGTLPSTRPAQEAR